MRFENEQLLQGRMLSTRLPAELRKCFFSESFILNKTLPGPFRILRRLYVGCRIKKDHSTAIRQNFNKRSHQQEFRFGQIVEGMDDHTLESPKPGNAGLSNP